VRTRSFTLYREFKWLHEQLCVQDCKEEGSAGYIEPPPEEIKKFLNDEINFSTTEPVNENETVGFRI